MREYIAILCDSTNSAAGACVKPSKESGDEFSVLIEVPDLVENVTQWVKEEYPEFSIVYIMPKGF